MAKTQVKQTVKKTPNKTTVTVGRLKTVRDSLNKESAEKTSAFNAMLNKSGKYSPEKRKTMTDMSRSGLTDSQRAKKYDGMIKKASSKKK